MIRIEKIHVLIKKEEVEHHHIYTNFTGKST
jgi:hypothetical protein